MSKQLYMLLIEDRDQRLSVYLMDELCAEFFDVLGNGSCRTAFDHFRTLKNDPAAQYAYVDGLLHGHKIFRSFPDPVGRSDGQPNPRPALPAGGVAE